MTTAMRQRSTPDVPRILLLRQTRVMLDEDLARVYGVATGQLNQAVRRNRRRFPGDFVFRLSTSELRNLKSQSVISSGRHGGRRTTPYAFTEHGAIMAASVLNTPRAVRMSVFVVRAFVRLREVAGAHAELAAKLADLERRVAGHDDDLQRIVEAIRRLLEPASKRVRQIGFRTAPASGRPPERTSYAAAPARARAPGTRRDAIDVSAAPAIIGPARQRSAASTARPRAQGARRSAR